MFAATKPSGHRGPGLPGPGEPRHGRIDLRSPRSPENLYTALSAMECGGGVLSPSLFVCFKAEGTLFVDFPLPFFAAYYWITDRAGVICGLGISVPVKFAASEQTTQVHAKRCLWKREGRQRESWGKGLVPLVLEGEGERHSMFGGAGRSLALWPATSAMGRLLGRILDAARRGPSGRWRNPRAGAARIRQGRGCGPHRPGPDGPGARAHTRTHKHTNAHCAHTWSASREGGGEQRRREASVLK